jgi:hypothetical protein
VEIGYLVFLGVLVVAVIIEETIRWDRKRRPRTRPCPRCGEKVMVGVLDCQRCGFDFRTVGSQPPADA